MTDISLSGPWTLADAAGTEVAPCPIPGDIHSALIAAGRIPDPMIGTREAEVQWVHETEWEIRRSFDLPADGACRQMAGARARIRRHRRRGDGQRHAGRQPRLELPSATASTSPAWSAPAQNDIAIRFRSATREAAARAAKQPFPIPTTKNNRVANLNMLRKPQCHGGWDWGPCLMVMGIYAEPRLRLYDDARIEHAVIRQDHHDDGRVTVTAEVELAARQDATVPVRLHFRRPDDLRRGHGDAAGGRAAISPRRSPSRLLWWPAGYGEQPLHDASVDHPRRPRRAAHRPAQAPPDQRAGRSRHLDDLRGQRRADLRQGRQLDPGRRAALAHHPRAHRPPARRGGRRQHEHDPRLGRRLLRVRRLLRALRRTRPAGLAGHDVRLLAIPLDARRS